MKYTCVHCHHTWTPRVAMPTACPACHCRKWNGDVQPPTADTRKTLECLRCHFRWRPQADKLPRVCPACNTPLWNTPRRRKLPASRLAKPKSAPRRSSAPRKPHPYKA